jgi:hypothetical protein
MNIFHIKHKTFYAVPPKQDTYKHNISQPNINTLPGILNIYHGTSQAARIRSRDLLCLINALPAELVPVIHYLCRSQWPRGLRRRYSATRLLRLWVRIPPMAWIFVCCDCCVLSGRGLCDGLINLPEESYRLWRAVVCDQETSKTRRLKPVTGL